MQILNVKKNTIMYTLDERLFHKPDQLDLHINLSEPFSKEIIGWLLYVIILTRIY